MFHLIQQNAVIRLEKEDLPQISIYVILFI